MSDGSDERLSAFLDGALDDAEMDEVRAALASDPALAERLAELASVDDALSSLPAPDVPPDLHARLRARIDAEPGASPEPLVRRAPPRRARWTSSFVAAAAAAVAAALVLFMLPRTSPDPEPGPVVVVREPEPPEATPEPDETPDRERVVAERSPPPSAPPEVATPDAPPVEIAEAPSEAPTDDAFDDLPNLLAPEGDQVADAADDADLIDLLDVLLVLELEDDAGTERG